MGRKFSLGHRRKRGHTSGAEQEGNAWQFTSGNVHEYHNESWCKFYRSTIVPDSEWEKFELSMKDPLPLSLRISSTLPTQSAQFIARTLVEALSRAELNPRVIPFVPRGLGFQADISRWALKRSEPHRDLKALITALNEAGYVSRQETVSMVPPIFLDVHPGHRVLDLCAAPGSKTTQMLELVAGACDQSGGCVVANDINGGRIDVMTHQTARLPFAQSHIVITRHNAMDFPLALAPEMKFDRVLCDVMCSGDGTLRKAADLWLRWTPALGPSMHIQQTRTLLRGMALCRKGGRLVYSTCSLNPVEDEAVVSYALTQAKGTFRLLPSSEALPGLVHYRGVSSWRLWSKDGTESFGSFAEAKKALPTTSFVPSMFPSSDAPAQHLDECIRVAPHLQDTGGFFLAAFECIDDFPGTSVPRTKHSKLDAWQFAPINAPLIAALQTEMGLTDEFPFGRLFAKTTPTKVHRVFFVQEAAAATAAVHPNLSIVQLGTKVIEGTHGHLRFVPGAVSVIADLLPRALVVRVPPLVLRHLIEAQGLTTLSALLSANRIDEMPAKPFVVQCTLPKIGDVHFCAALMTPKVPSDLSWSAAVAATLPTSITHVVRVCLGMKPQRATEAEAEAGGGDNNSSVSDLQDDGVAALEESTAPGI